ncbi:hypothetical protein FIBSPDRAFT_769245, partial [Athelia psychrophila]
NGTDPGNPLSMPLYGFYGPGLLEESDNLNELQTVFVDDTTLVAAGETFEETMRSSRR